ncbi:MAG TPA: ABC transporter substrate-binding protein [Syntrophorhabdaceae bacterium]|nr:ABC transporter substrate-binding protein [Syntrophorhabdaceae bacterium]
MISYEQALQTVLENVHVLRPERRSILKGTGRACAPPNFLLGAACVLIVAALTVLAPVGGLQARELTDIFGRRIAVPDRIRHAWATSPPATYMLYAMDPGVLAGLNTPVREWERNYFRRDIQQLPVLGGWYGQGNVPNIEMVLKVNPEIIIATSLNSSMEERKSRTLRDVPIPVVGVKMERLSDYPDAFTFLGEALGRRERGKKLSDYARKTIGKMSAIVEAVPPRQRVSVYYAEAEDGLSTACHGSMHAELIALAGGRNVHRCPAKDVYGMEKVSMEQVLLYDPEVILVFEPLFFKGIFSDPRWRQIRAVKERKVYLIPRQPFNWFDRPPSFMRLLGLTWLTNLLHPDLYPVDIVKETQAFFRLFLGIDLTGREAMEIIHPRGDVSGHGTGITGHRPHRTR